MKNEQEDGNHAAGAIVPFTAGPVSRDRGHEPAGQALPTDEPPDIDAARKQVLDKAKREGRILRDLSCGLYLAAALGPSYSQQIGPTGYHAYRDQLVRDAGNPGDPIEVMMIEQAALAHHQIATLHVRAAAATTVEATKAYQAVACRLMGEFRRLVLALQTYRAPARPKQFTVVKQQNVAAGDQQIAMIDKSAVQDRVPFFPSSNQLDRGQAEVIYEQEVYPYAQSSACCRGEAELAEEERVHAGGAGAAASGRVTKQALAALDRAQDA